MDQRDYELERIKSNNKILKNILIGLVSTVLIYLFIRYNPDYDISIVSLDTVGFILFVVNSLYILNQVANIFEKRRKVKQAFEENRQK